MNYTTSSVEEAIDEISTSGCGRISFRVKGYWSSDSITIYLRRGFSVDASKVEIDISHASGGRDKKEVASDFEATRYFGEALIAASEMAQYILEERLDEINARYDEYRAELKAAALVAAKEQEEKVAADPAIGESRAESFLGSLGNATYQTIINLIPRGSEFPARKIGVKNGARTTYFTEQYGRQSRITRKEAVAALAAASVRSIA